MGSDAHPLIPAARAGLHHGVWVVLNGAKLRCKRFERRRHRLGVQHVEPTVKVVHGHVDAGTALGAGSIEVVFIHH